MYTQLFLEVCYVRKTLKFSTAALASCGLFARGWPNPQSGFFARPDVHTFHNLIPVPHDTCATVGCPKAQPHKKDNTNVDTIEMMEARLGMVET